MKYFTTFMLMLCFVLGLTGCRLNYKETEEIQDFLDGIAEAIGDSQLTEDEDLIGTRVLSSHEDSYAGEYTADCDHVTGRDVVFGGASIQSREFFLSGTIEAESGKAIVRIRLNDEVIELETDTDGNFETTLKLESGGNYIMVVYEDFSGSVKMTCEYVGLNDGYAK